MLDSGLLVLLGLYSGLLEPPRLDSGLLVLPGLDSGLWAGFWSPGASWAGFWRPGGSCNRTTELTDRVSSEKPSGLDSGLLGWILVSWCFLGWILVARGVHIIEQL